MRASDYNIYVKLDNNPNYYFLVQGYTGAIDLTKTEIALLLKKSKNSDSFDQINSETLALLKKRGYITSKTKEEERKHLQNISGFVHKKSRKLNSFLFAVTQNCNFRCPYCYENGVSNHGNDWSKSVFTKEMVDKAYAAMLNIQPDRNNRKDVIGLYGGEPLLKENYEIVKYIIEKGKEQGYSFRATTNAYDIDHFTDLLGNGNIDVLQTTIDGLRNTNNKRRVHFQNKDTFSKIISNIEIALEKGVRIYNRVNVDKSNFSEVEELMRYFKKRGFLDNSNFSTYLGNVFDNEAKCHAPSSKEFSNIDYLERAISLKEKDSSINVFGVQDYNVKEDVKKIVRNNSLMIPKITYCGANTGMLIFDPKGDIYTCWEKLGIKNHAVGTFKNDFKFNKTVLDAWQNRTVGNVEQCSKCKYALWCGGGCAAMLKPREDININRSNCMDYPKVFAKMINNLYDHEYSKELETQDEL